MKQLATLAILNVILPFKIRCILCNDVDCKDGVAKLAPCSDSSIDPKFCSRFVNAHLILSSTITIASLEVHM